MPRGRGSLRSLGVVGKDTAGGAAVPVSYGVVATRTRWRVQPPVARQWSLLQAMYYGPVIDRTIGSSCSASDLQQPRSPRPRRRRRVAAAPGVADDADNEDELRYHEPAYVVLDVQSNEKNGHRIGCHAAPRPGRRRTGGNAIRILLLATAAAFFALAVSPGKF